MQGLDAGGDQPPAGGDQLARLNLDALGMGRGIRQVDVLATDLKGTVADQAATGAVQALHSDGQQSLAGVLNGTALVDQSLRR
ncbi:hypothetical protein D3C77_621790 [compost metagenome]